MGIDGRPRLKAVDGEPILAARGLVYTYPDGPRALAGVDIEVASGELVAVLGPNGSGKSTLVKLLAGSLAPDLGRVRCGGESLSALSPTERARRIALVPQFLPMLPDVGVLSFVESGRYAHRRGGLAARLLGATLGAPDELVAREALRACDVQDLADRPMTALSGGQRQRVLVARAIAQESSILLVDEPTSALDPEHQVQVFDVLAGACARARAVLVVTHDLNLAAQYATRLVLLDAGRVVASGAPEAVLVREVLEPVYGRHLEFVARSGRGAGRVPIVVASREPR